jgi:Subtilase family
VFSSLRRRYSSLPLSYCILLLLLPLLPNTSPYLIILLLTLGRDIDVFIVDTGMDTKHVEFASTPGSNRIVKNLYDSFAYDSDNPSEDNDDVGHGTHVAGSCWCRCEAVLIRCYGDMKCAVHLYYHLLFCSILLYFVIQIFLLSAVSLIFVL